MDVGQRGLAPIGTGASSEEGAASTKEIPAGEGGGEGRVGRCATNELDGLRLGRFTRGREERTMPGWSSRCSWGSRLALRGCLRKARIEGMGYVLVPRWAESGESFAADRTSAIKGGVLTSTVDAERSGGIGRSYYRILQTSFRAPLVSPSVG